METPEQTLAREIHEELGATVTWIGPWQPFTLHISTSSDGTPIDLHHSGLLADIRCGDRLTRVQDVEDVSDVVLIDPSRTDQDQLSAPLQFALRRATTG